MSTIMDRLLEVIRVVGRSSPAETVRLRINIGGFGTDEPVSVRAAIDVASGRVRIATEGPLEVKDRPGWVLVSNLMFGDQRVDVQFRQDDLRAAIGAYFDMSSMQLLSFAPGMERCRPDAKIESDGMDERGRRYRVMPDCGNRHVAVTVAAWYASQQLGMDAAMDMFDDIYGPMPAGPLEGDGLDAFTT